MEHFRTLLSIDQSSTPCPLPAALLLLEYVRVFLLEDQRRWFAAKAGKFETLVGQAALWRALATLMIAAAALPAVLPLVVALLPADALLALPAMPAIAAWTVEPGNAAALAFVGVAGGALQGLILSLSAISLIDRNAVTYRSMTEVLDRIDRESLPSARAGAISGDRTELEKFWNDLSFQLLSEQREWSAVLGNVQLLALSQLNRLAKPG